MDPIKYNKTKSKRKRQITKITTNQIKLKYPIKKRSIVKKYREGFIRGMDPFMCKLHMRD